MINNKKELEQAFTKVLTKAVREMGILSLEATNVTPLEVMQAMHTATFKLYKSQKEVSNEMVRLFGEDGLKGRTKGAELNQD